MRTSGGRLTTKAPLRLQPPPKQTDPHYTTKEHRDWSRSVIARAGGKCQACGRTGTRLFADHIVELKDGGAPFDLDNGQGLCGSCHSLKTNAARVERDAGPDVAANNHPGWLLPSRIPLTIVCGPPGSGKNRFVAQRAGAKDLVIDLDEIASRLSGQPIHGWDRSWLNAAIRERNRLLGLLAKPQARQWKAAWFIVGEPTAKRRQWWADKLQPKAVVVLAVQDETCIRRLEKDNRPRAQDQSAAVYRWWSQYTPRRQDIVIPD